MRTTIRTSTNRLVLSVRQERLLTGGKDGVRVVDNQRMRLFSPRARQAMGSFLAVLLHALKSALAAAPRPAYASATCSQPALAHRCWHRSSGAQHPFVSQG